MTTTLHKELTASDLDELGIDAPRSPFWEAYRNDEDTVTILVADEEGGGYLDPPNEDHSGEDAWEWIAFDGGQERDEWRLENSVCSGCGQSLYWGPAGLGEPTEDEWRHELDGSPICPAAKPALAPTDILIERYEHGLVNYAPIGEASQVDRQWDVAFGVAVMRFTKPDTIGPDDDPDKLLNFARAVCEDYTAWCNGDVYGMIRWERVAPPVVPLMEPGDFTDQWQETDSCCGFIGYRYAEQIAKTGDW
jgi:hypothetical protein